MRTAIERKSEDILTGFVVEAEKKGFVIRNYANLKAQCYFKLKEMMEKRMIRVYAD